VRTYTLYRKDTGEIVGHYTGSKRHLPANVPEGCAAVVGRYEPSGHRIDPASGNALTLEHRHSDSGRRARELKLRIEDLERRQARPLRELMLDPNDQDARRRVEDIDADIRRLRAQITSLAEHRDG